MGILFSYMLKYLKGTYLVSIEFAEIQVMFYKVSYVEMSPRPVLILLSGFIDSLFANINADILFLLELVSLQYFKQVSRPTAEVYD